MTRTAGPTVQPAPLLEPSRPSPVLAPGRRVEALDGVRALAVTIVVVTHALPTAPFPGAVGVDVFFVVSGYLITALLLAEQDRYGDVSVPRFWARRLLRTAPPLLFMLVALHPLGVRLVGDEYVDRALLAVQFRANLALTVERVSVSPLEHTWSLAQEMQFYLVWPLVLVLLLALRLPREVVAAGARVGAGLCFRALQVVQEADPLPSDDFRLDGRGGGLLVGCALGLLLSRHRVAVPGLAEVGLALLLGLCAVAVLVMAVPLQVAVPVAVLATGAVVAGLQSGASGPASGLLAWPPLASLGRMSYSLYLWHYVFFRAFEQRPDLPLPLVLLLEVVLSVAAAAMSYAVIEEPIARWSARRLHR